MRTLPTMGKREPGPASWQGCRVVRPLPAILSLLALCAPFVPRNAILAAQSENPPVKPPPAKAVQAFLKTPPESGRIVFECKGAPTPPGVYEFAWFKRDLILRRIVTNAPSAGLSGPERASGIWGGIPWGFGSGTIEFYATLPQPMEATKKTSGTATPAELVGHQLLCLGVQFLTPGGLTFANTAFTATLGTGMKIAGDLSIGPDGRLQSLEYRMVETPSSFKVSYDYTRSLSLPIPNYFRAESYYSNTLHTIASPMEFDVLECQPSLSLEQWAQYNPTNLYPAARTLVHRNGTYYLLTATNPVVFFSSEPTPARSPWRVRLVILVGLAFLSPFVYFSARSWLKWRETNHTST
jgi:hypothetical protein